MSLTNFIALKKYFIYLERKQRITTAVSFAFFEYDLDEKSKYEWENKF